MTESTAYKQPHPTTFGWVAESFLKLVGNTPLVPLRQIAPECPHDIWAKLEFLNPTGSIKDRMALYIVEEAERSGEIKPGDLLIDNSSGNTAVSVGMVGACKGYPTLFTVPDKTSQEKIDLIRAMGSEIIICPTAVAHDHPDSYYSAARRLARERPGFLINQYHNSKNIDSHYYTTGREIWEQTDGQVDVVVAGIGTGGTLSGIGRFLKEKNPDIQIIAADPVGSIFHDYVKFDRLTEPGRYFVEGVGTDVPCDAFDPSVVDEIIQVDDQEAFTSARRIVNTEGMIVGGSSGTAMSALLKWVSTQPREPKLRIITLLPDSGMRYVSKFLNDKWMRDHGFQIET